MKKVHGLASRHYHWMIGMKVVANPIKVNVMNVVRKNKKRKLKKQERNKTDKSMRKKNLKIRCAGGCVNVSNVASLPEDIITDVLTLLPVKSLLRFRCVSKSWNNLLKSTSFAKLQLDFSLKSRNNDGILIEYGKRIGHLDYDSLLSDSSTLYDKLVPVVYPLEYEKMVIIGSCNGLICSRSRTFQKDFIIWNPLTRDYKKIPTPPEPSDISDSYGYGFAYDLKTEDYELILYVCEKYPISCIHVYSMKLNSWKTIRNIPDEGPSNDKLVFFNGFFHWVDFLKELRGRKDMCCFDTATETLKHIALPESVQDMAYSVQVCLLGGCLCIVVMGPYYNNLEVWTMKDYGVAESWTQLFTIDKDELSRFLHLDMKQFFKSDAILVHHSEYFSPIYLYDVNHEVSRKLQIDVSSRFTTWGFFGTLVSPNSLSTCLDRQ